MTHRTALLAVGVGLALADSSIVTLALPEILGQFDVAITSVAWVLTSFNLVLAVVAVPAAYVSRRRPREAFAIGVLIFASASLDVRARTVVRRARRRALRSGGRRGADRHGCARSSLAGRRERRARAARLGRCRCARVRRSGLRPEAILTQLLGWESIFLAQVPVALALLLAVRGVAARSVSAPAGRPSIAANAALLLVAGGLVAALFLVVLLLVDGWGMSPAAAGLVVTVMPLTAIAVRRLSPRSLGIVQGVAAA